MSPAAARPDVAHRLRTGTAAYTAGSDVPAPPLMRAT